MWWPVSHGGKGLLRARSNWRHAVAVSLPIIGESSNNNNNNNNNKKQKMKYPSRVSFSVSVSINTYNNNRRPVSSVL